MSTELLESGPLLITQFWGGADRGICLQFTPTTDDYAQLTRPEVVELARVVNAWLGDPVLWGTSSVSPEPLP